MYLDILLATYNGEKYLKEQLDSLTKQTYKHWSLLVHDDGSTDTTIEIIRHYAKHDKRIKILDDGILGLGAANNFIHLLKHADADIIMFCDQDDIWLPDKIEVMVNSIKDVTGPAMVYSNANSYKSGKVLSEKVIMFHATKLNNTLFLNGGVHGCLQIINRALRNLVVEYRGYVCMHDHLITLAAVSFGSVKYIDRALMNYRQHSENVTLGYETNVLKKVKNFINSDVGVVDIDHYKATQAFYEYYKNSMSSEQRKIFSAYFSFIVSPFWKRLKIIYKYKFKIGRTVYILLIKTILRKPLGVKH